MKNANILIVDDNKGILTALELLLNGRCNKVRTLNSPNQLLTELAGNNYKLLLLDMNFSAGVNTGNEGLYWLQRVQEIDPELSVVMITAYGDVELAVKAVKNGAADFVLKPWENEKLLTTILSALRLNQSKMEVGKLKQKERELIGELNRSTKNIIGDSPSLKRVLELVGKVAGTNANVLITGENGTGKELIAHEVHRLSGRSNEILVTVDMGAVAETLFESELFGHKKGAFTDAHSDRTGKIEMANGGTLFLDEIGNLTLALQAKLLSAIQNRIITKVGDNKPVSVDIRLICATNCDLQSMVQDVKFREDLLYRINTIQIEVPPLRERMGDVAILASFFLKKYAKKYNKEWLAISENALSKLNEYQWPGNVRELQHAVEKAVILCEAEQIECSDFMFHSVTGNVETDMPETLADMEKLLIQKTLNQYDGNFTAAARQLGVTRQTLYNKINRYGL